MLLGNKGIMTSGFGGEVPAEWWGFYVEALEAGATVSMAKAGSPPTVSLEYSVDGGSTWSSFDANGGTTTVTLAKVRSRAYFRAVTTNARLASSTSAYHKFVLGKSVAVGGNILSLLSSTEISAFPSTGSSASYCLSCLFYGATTLVDASALALPDSAMPQYCYAYMFSGCTSLAAASALPATTLETCCYRYMFNGCISLTAAPELPATTLASYCYSAMFYGCTSLTAAPELPATTLADNCYNAMFQGCASLTAAPGLPATTLASFCYYYMFYGCTSLTAAPALPATTLETRCYYYMFSGCTSLTAAPALPATTLESYCYSYMFYGCTSLTAAPALPATTLDTNCYAYMFYGCTSLMAAPALPATTLRTRCYYFMFCGCSKLMAAPALPATTLADYCYQQMFQRCSTLRQITTAHTAWSPTNATTNWVSGLSSGGIFACPAALPQTRGTNYIPTGWTIINDVAYDTDIRFDAYVADTSCGIIIDASSSYVVVHWGAGRPQAYAAATYATSQTDANHGTYWHYVIPYTAASAGGTISAIVRFAGVPGAGGAHSYLNGSSVFSWPRSGFVVTSFSVVACRSDAEFAVNSLLTDSTGGGSTGSNSRLVSVDTGPVRYISDANVAGSSDSKAPQLRQLKFPGIVSASNWNLWNTPLELLDIGKLSTLLPETAYTMDDGNTIRDLYMRSPAVVQVDSEEQEYFLDDMAPIERIHIPYTLKSTYQADQWWGQVASKLVADL